jgi:serine/threonine protein kinase
MLFEDVTETIINQRYLIISILGKGGNGITYTAKDLTTQETVLLKRYL